MLSSRVSDEERNRDFSTIKTGDHCNCRVPREAVSNVLMRVFRWHTGLALLQVCLVLPVFSQSPCETPGPIPFQDHGKWGYLSGKGIVIAARFDFAGPFTDDGAVVCDAAQCGLIDKNGRFISPTWRPHRRLFPQHFSEGLSPAIEDGKWGYVDRKRTIVIPFQFEHAQPFENGMAMVALNKKTFFINRQGQRITPLFDWAFDFHDDLAAVGVGDKVGYIRRDGSYAIPPINHSASGIDFAEGLVAVRVKGKVGFMDRTGKIVIQPKYDDVFPFSDGLAPVQLAGKWGYVDKKGNLTLPIQYYSAEMFSEGVAVVRLDSGGQYIKPDGSPAFAGTFVSAMPFCGGVASVATAHIIGEPPDTRPGCITTWFKGKHGVINHDGNYVWRDAEEQTWPGVCN